MTGPGMHSGIATDDAMNLAMSEKAIPLYEAVKQFIKNEVEPITPIALPTTMSAKTCRLPFPWMA